MQLDHHGTGLAGQGRPSSCHCCAQPINDLSRSTIGCLGLQPNGQRLGVAQAHLGQGEDLHRAAAQPARELVVVNACAHQQGLVHLQHRPARLKELVKDGDFHARGAIVQGNHPHHAALGHLGAAVDHHACNPERLPAGHRTHQGCAGIAAQLLGDRVKEAAREAVAQRRLLLQQGLARAVGLDLGLPKTRCGQARWVCITKQASLMRIGLGVVCRLAGQGNLRDQHRAFGPPSPGALRMERIKRTGLDQGLHGPPVHHAPVDPGTEVKEVSERALLARGQNVLHGRLAHPAHRPQSIANGPGTLGGLALWQPLLVHPPHGLKPVLAAVYVWCEHPQAIGLGVLHQEGDLVGVIHFRGQGGGQKLRRVVGLEPGGLIGDDRIGGGVALVKAILRKLLHEVKELGGQGRAVALLLRALQENTALLGHFLGLLLAHGPAQQVRTTQGVARHDLGNLHDLLLVDDDAVGGREALF